MGEALDAMPKAKGGKQYHKSTGSNIEPVATLEQIGLSGSAGKHRSTRARKLKAHRVNAAGRTQVRVDDSVGPPPTAFPCSAALVASTNRPRVAPGAAGRRLGLRPRQCPALPGAPEGRRRTRGATREERNFISRSRLGVAP